MSSTSRLVNGSGSLQNKSGFGWIEGGFRGRCRQMQHQYIGLHKIRWHSLK